MAYGLTSDFLMGQCTNAYDYFGAHFIKQGKTKYGLTVFKCKDCGKKFNIFTGTIMEKTPYSWKVWVTILEQMLRNQSIKTTREYLINRNVVRLKDVSNSIDDKENLNKLMEDFE